MWKQAIVYGVLLAAGTAALQRLDYQRVAQAHSGGIYIFRISAAFLALGVYVGVLVSLVSAGLSRFSSFLPRGAGRQVNDFEWYVQR